MKLGTCQEQVVLRDLLNAFEHFKNAKSLENAVLCKVSYGIYMYLLSQNEIFSILFSI